MRSSFNVHILEMYIIYVTYNVYILIYLFIYLFIFFCIAYISSHSKGPEQDQLRSPFVPYVRNTAERSIHNFDSGPYIYICKDYHPLWESQFTNRCNGMTKGFEHCNVIITCQWVVFKELFSTPFEITIYNRRHILGMGPNQE